MKRYKLLDGFFEGAVIGESVLLDVPFKELDEVLQESIDKYGFYKYVGKDNKDIFKKYPVTAEELKREYEQSWTREETDEEITCLPWSSPLSARQYPEPHPYQD